MLALPFALLSACTTVGPDYVPPENPIPDDWKPSSNEGLTTSDEELARWWDLFDDPVMSELVRLALRQNYSLELAGLRVLEARAQLGVATGARYPQQQFAAGGVSRIAPSENAGGAADAFSQYDLGASISWEIDFWGRFQRGIESADARLAASVAAYDSAVVLLISQVVDSYAAVRTLEEQLEIARFNLDIQQRSYDMAEVLYRNGQDSELDVQQALTLLLSTKSTIPDLETQLHQAKNALSTLLGQATGSVDALLGEGEIPEVPDQLAIGIPADLVRRRPDVRQAELQAVAQNALIGVAVADLYPSISIGGAFGVASISGSAGGGGASELFSSDSVTYNAGASITWPFLNYGRIRNNIRVQDARLQQALVAYQQTVIEAAREVDDAIAALAGNQEQETILADTVTAAKRSNELSVLRYREGFSGYQRVLDAQKSLFTQQSRYVENRGNSVRFLVAVYRALGGGWEVRQGRPFVDEDTMNVMRARTNWGALLDSPVIQESGDQGLRPVDW
jgi:NodT family efflux transporter outer membrane factor (OMF) lipoprotein